jgi:hypothetical protein
MEDQDIAKIVQQQALQEMEDKRRKQQEKKARKLEKHLRYKMIARIERQRKHMNRADKRRGAFGQ